MKKAFITGNNKILNLTDCRFGRLIVTDRLKKCKNNTKRLCICDCGKRTWVATSALISGHTKSCGCYRVDCRKLPFGIAVRNQILDDYKRGAKSRKLIWKLTDKYFDKLLKDRCYFCGILPQTTRGARRNNGNFTYNGIDRLDSKIGYIKSNVVSCCKVCNRAKSDMSLKEFISWIKNIISNNK